MPIPALASIPLIYKLLAGLFIGGGLGIKGYTEYGKLGVAKSQQDLQLKAMETQAAATKQVAKSKRRQSRESMEELRAVMRERQSTTLLREQIRADSDQQIADQMMITRLMSAIMGGGKYERPSPIGPMPMSAAQILGR